MRNLRNVHRRLLRSLSDLQLGASTWDARTDSVILAYGPTKDNVLIQIKRWRTPLSSSTQGLVAEDAVQDIVSWDAPCPLPNLECDEILSLQYFSDSLTICLILAGGDIVLIREDPQVGEEKIEIVGSVDAGISAAGWSPDGELLVIATRANTFLYMTRDFENVVDLTFSSEDLKASKHISVGWGKSETQFKGNKSRLLRDPTMPETVDEGKLSDFDNNRSSISWRGDGSYVAINSIESGRRVIRVYSREGTLDSASEPVDGLIDALSWRPTGNVLSGIKRLEDRVDVVFFERNGLRHGQFSLRLTQDEMADWAFNMSLKWNIDSSVLAVCFKDRVQLWTMGNYHYYLKQEILSPPSNSKEKPVALEWHPESPLRFTIGSGDGIQRLEYNLVVGAGPTLSPDDYGIIAVVDGKSLKLNSLRLANIPPPMALFDISLSENAVDVAVTVIKLKKTIAFICVLYHEAVALFEWDLTAKPSKSPSLKWLTQLSRKDPPGAIYRQVAFSDQKILSVLSSDVGGSFIHFVNLDNGSVSVDVPFLKEEVRSLITPLANKNAKSAILIIESAVMELSLPKSDQFVKSSLLRWNILPNLSPRVEAVSFQIEVKEPVNGTFQTKDGRSHVVVFGLSDNGSLFANQRLLARNCTSFLVTPAHLIFTTGQHYLKFVHMAKVDGLDVPPDTPEIDERCRSIERGAKLVTVMPSIFALVLQMPRGNLETIYPRALVLAGIRHSINDRKYKKAFLACRSQRVDMNILHDHDPSTFLANIGLFVDQLGKVEFLDLFLSQLREEDVSKTMYIETSAATTQGISDKTNMISKSLDDGVSKVNTICNAFLRALQSRTSSRFQNVITAHVCKNPPSLDAGLAEIAKIRYQNPSQTDKMVEHICFLADVNRLYDNALGIYDLELTLLIAQQSQKDPREYLPFLQNLQGMPLLRRHYFIDNHLGRYQKALKHLYDLNDHDEVKSFTVKHALYADSLSLYRYQEDHLSDIMRLYADNLQKKSKFKEAGIAYEYLHDHAAASESYRLAHLWKESISCASNIPLPQDQLHSLSRSLGESLIESKDFFSVATIHLDYLSDVPTAARLFCKGYFFADALRTIGLHNRPDLYESVLDVGLVEGMASMTELLADCKSQLNAQVPRIHELRAKKAEDPLAFFDGDINAGADIPDNVSLAPTDTSVADGSLFTRYTNRTGTIGTNATRKTSKNRRREERKRARGKKGSVYEEEYLVNSVGRLVDRVNSVRDEVSRLIVGLMRRGMRERARAVEAAMADVVALCQNCIGEVFLTETKEMGMGGGEDVERPIGGDGVLWDSIASEKRREVPVVKDFEMLSLLGL